LGKNWDKEIARAARALERNRWEMENGYVPRTAEKAARAPLGQSVRVVGDPYKKAAAVRQAASKNRSRRRSRSRRAR